MVFLFRFYANVCVFFVCCLKYPSDLAMISLSSVMNIWVWPALSLRGRPRGAGPLPGTLKVRLAKEGGLTFITPPRFVLLFPTVPAAKLCICDCMVKGLHLSDLFMLPVNTIIALVIAGTCGFSACCLNISIFCTHQRLQRIFFSQAQHRISLLHRHHCYQKDHFAEQKVLQLRATFDHVLLYLQTLRIDHL